MVVTDSSWRALADLEAEGAALDDIVSRPGVELDLMTPSVGWTIRRQLDHLLRTDRVMLLACRDPAAFAKYTETYAASLTAADDPSGTTDDGAPDGVIAAWRDGRADLLSALRAQPSGTRIPWFGPSMDLDEIVSVRIMETWAHGLDVTDALGQPAIVTSRLRHVADLGVQTRDFAYALHGARTPGQPFRFELIAPNGDSWTWGPRTATDRIAGSALDFCLLVTQRRHLDDLDLQAEGPAAKSWLDIAQAFAGPAGPGRSAGVPVLTF